MRHRLLYHLLFWIGYVLFETYVEFAWISSSFASTPPLERWIMALEAECTLVLIKVPLCYFLSYLLNTDDHVLFKGALRKVTITILSFIIATLLHRLLIVFFILPYFYHEAASASALFEPNRIMSSFLDLIFVAGLLIAFNQYRMQHAMKEKQKGLEKEKLEAELKFLRAQTNPHFLFNTLNNIYALARKKADETPEVVMKLSKLLRFMLYESARPSITLAEELRVMDDYIELERIRYDERLEIQLERSVDNEQQAIAPLILLPFVENAFKHGASESRFQSFIHLSITLQDGVLTFMISNSMAEADDHPIQENIGLSNVRRQLQLMYPDHQLSLESLKNRFSVCLILNLQSYATVPVHHR
ncbi:MAG: histidine kinase [Chitinophagaceae bacterium]